MTPISVETSPRPAAVAPARTHTADDFRMARGWADFYRNRGYNVLPSRPDEKRPLVRWSEYLDRPFPAEQFARFETGSLQIMTGRRWGLVVVDLDGPEAIARWPELLRSCPRTWITHSGGDGRHVWFSVPTEGPPIASGRLWGIWQPEARDGRGEWAKHKAIEILGDRKLVMAPPSIHPTTGKRYRFVGGHSPKEVFCPAPLPRELLAMPRLAAPRPAWNPSVVARTPGKAPGSPVAGRLDWKAVLDRIPDKIAVAERWGLRFATRRPNGSGWCQVHAVGREDRNPSASFHPETGRYWEPELGCIGFFRLGVLLGRYSDWREAVADLAGSVGVRGIAS